MAGKVKRWLEDLSTKDPLRRGFIVFLLVTVVVFILSWPFYLKDFLSFLENVLVEAHGILFDLLVIGVFILWLNRLAEQWLTIRRYREEVNDYLGWRSDEAMYRIVGNIKRLNREGVTDIMLARAYLQKADLRGANLERANLEKADLRGAILYKVNLNGANLRGANLSQALLLGANLREADLLYANLREASLGGTNLHRAKLYEADLNGAGLRGANLRGAKYNTKEYYLVDQVNDVAVSYQATQWPAGFDPKETGAIDVSEQPDYPPWLSKRIEDAHWR